MTEDNYQGFPPLYTKTKWTFFWDSVKYGFKKLLGRAIGSLVLPAQDMDYEETIKQFNLNFRKGRYELFNADIHYPCVTTYDGANLNTCEFIHDTQKGKPIAKQTYMISYVGNGMCYESDIYEIAGALDTLNCNVIGFNFRGVAGSSGRAMSKDDLLTDSITQVQRLLDKDVTPSNIVLKGHSLGASIATLTAAHFHKQGININVFNGRSFSLLSDVPVGLVKKHLGPISSFIVAPIIKLILWLTDWEIDAVSAYQSIPEENRDYLVVLGKDNQSDPVITTYGSLHTALNTKEQKKSSHVISTPQFNSQAHNVPLKYLKSDYFSHKNGFDLFTGFFIRTTKRNDNLRDEQVNESNAKPYEK